MGTWVFILQFSVLVSTLEVSVVNSTYISFGIKHIQS